MAELLYGRNAVREALRAGRRRFYRLHIAEGARGEPVEELRRLAGQRRVPVLPAGRQELDRRVEGNHQGVMLEAGPYPYVDLDVVFASAESRGEPPLILMLDHLQDPQNAGTLLRTAEIVGVHGVILPDRRSLSITPAVVNSSAGAVEHLNIVKVTNLAQTILQLQEHGIWVVGLEDDPRAKDYDAIDLSGPLAIVVGAEGPGLARLVRERCDLLVRLPMRGQIASLNAAVAGSILLYQLWRGRQRKTGA
ncbi:MAG: 23S rRNA (guanosine(2251)-2'-O)-methyltransferase RlmB [Herpetosiphonaceae bacterium]|nr:MAG: 23S rRNA (guanosine(2251)-2'-O)-methyltransferase RlmB [Herpetosiphonaceae bacterium]